MNLVGARKYLMKEPDSSLKRCKRRLFYFFLADRLVRIILFGYIAYLIAKRFNLFGKEDIDEELLLRLTNNDTIIGKFWFNNLKLFEFYPFRYFNIFRARFFKIVNKIAIKFDFERTQTNKNRWIFSSTTKLSL